MRRIDLHAHSNASDGTDAPGALPALARDAGLAAFALTDHDTLAGIPAARSAGEELGVEVVPAVELGARLAGRELHVLGYFLEPGNGAFEAFLARLREGRRARAAEIVARLREIGVDVTIEEVREEARATGVGGSVGRPHVASVLVAKGVVASVREAFDRYLADGGPAYVPRPMPTPVEAVEAISGAGGVAVVAHPVTLPPGALVPVVRELADAGLGGIEVFHSDQDAATRAELLRLADDLDLVPTGGSDYHGARKPDVRLGTGRAGNVDVGYGTLEALRARRPGA